MDTQELIDYLSAAAMLQVPNSTNEELLHIILVYDLNQVSLLT